MSARTYQRDKGGKFSGISRARLKSALKLALAAGAVGVSVAALRRSLPRTDAAGTPIYKGRVPYGTKTAKARMKGEFFKGLPRRRVPPPLPRANPPFRGR